MEKVLGAKVVTAGAAAESALPPQIQEALGELVGRRGRDCSPSASALGWASCTS